MAAAAVIAGTGPFGPTTPLFGQAAADPDPFPLEVGNSWTYAGTVWWMPRYSRQILEERVELEVEVVDVVERRGVRAAILEGHPHDLISRTRQSRQRYLLIQVGGDRVYLLEGSRYREAWRRLRDSADSLVGLVTSPELLLEMPLFEGKRQLCPDIPAPNGIGRGCWRVRSEEVIDLTSIWGLEEPEKRERYTLDLRHRGEHDVWGFVPGVGFTFYGVGYPGDPSAVELDLIQVQFVESPVRPLQTTVHLGETAVHGIESSRHPRVEAALRRLQSPEREVVATKESGPIDESVPMHATGIAEVPEPIPLAVPAIVSPPELPELAVVPLVRIEKAVEKPIPLPVPDLPACLDNRREWVRNGAPVEYDGQTFEPMGHPEPVSSDNLVAVAQHDGVPLYVGRLISPPYIDLWLPRCDPPGMYSLYMKSARASGADR